MLRVGATHEINKISISGGMRMECVPAEDLIVVAMDSGDLAM
jgi:hypothetical protein